MTQKYKFIRVRADTLPNLKQRVQLINNDMNHLGLKKCKMSVLDFVHLLSQKPIYLTAGELAKLTRRRALKV